MNLNEKLQALSGQEPSGWLQKAEERKQNRSWQKRSAAIALRVLRELRQQGLTQRELAARMSVSAQQVNKIVKGQENMTLDTLDRLERALDIQLLHDGKTQPAAVLDFGSQHVALKHSSLVSTFQQCSLGFRTGITMTRYEIDIKPALIEPNDKYLHKQYPIPGKEKWLQLHTERS